jgi:hypothetical protein
MVGLIPDGFTVIEVVGRGAKRMDLRVLVFLVFIGFLGSSSPTGWGADSLPTEPDLNTRVDELYDHEARLFILLYSLSGDGKVDYVTARLVREYSRSAYGNPIYQTEAQPLFYWWNHIMWNDPEQDGVNGNEKVYQENTDFDISRYKPCLFNGQPC